MAGTVSIARQPVRSTYSGKVVEKITLSWTSDASGNADLLISSLFGYVIRLVTDPGDGPTDNYDVTLIDENGSDALQGAGADRDTTNSESVYPTPTSATIPPFIAGDATFTIANAGNAKSGTTVLYVAESL